MILRIGTERYFFVLEGVMVILAVLLLNVFHPGSCLQDAYHREKDMQSSDTEMAEPAAAPKK